MPQQTATQSPTCIFFLPCFAQIPLQRNSLLCSCLSVACRRVDRAPTSGQHLAGLSEVRCNLGRKPMQRILSLLAISVCANALVSLSASAQTKPEVTLTRLDCGTNQAPTEVNLRFSDTYAYGDLKLQI